MKPFLRDQGFLLRSVSYGDHHRILIFLTRNHGKIDLFVPGAKKSRKRGLALLDFLNLLDLEIRHQEGNKLSQLTQCELLESFPFIRKDFDKIQTALAWLRLVEKTVALGLQIENLFSLLEGFLRELEQRDPVWTDLIFRKRLLTVLGYHLDWERCSGCHQSEPGQYYFDPHHGGIRCARCMERPAGESGPTPFHNRLWKLSGKSNPWEEKEVKRGMKYLEMAYQELVGVSFGKAVPSGLSSKMG